MQALALEYLMAQGFDVELYAPFGNDLHGTSSLPGDRLTLHLANPYRLRDVPRIKTYINAYTTTPDTIQLVIDKLMGRSEFMGIDPVDPFCGLPDARL